MPLWKLMAVKCVFQIIDPFVEVEVIGLPIDCCKEQTRVVDDNGKWQAYHQLIVNAFDSAVIVVVFYWYGFKNKTKK